MGHDVWLYAADKQTADPIPRAEARLTWRNGPRSNFVERAARPDGYINVWSVTGRLRGYSCEWAPGYVPLELRDFEVPVDTTIAVDLERAGVLRGQVLFEGDPRPGLSGHLLEGWATPHPHQGTVPRCARKGTSELDRAPLGDVRITADAPGLQAPPPIALHLKPGHPHDVSIELVRPLLGRGSVVDAASNEPIGDALAYLLMSGDSGPVGRLGKSASSRRRRDPRSRSPSSSARTTWPSKRRDTVTSSPSSWLKTTSPL